MVDALQVDHLAALFLTMATDDNPTVYRNVQENGGYINGIAPINPKDIEDTIETFLREVSRDTSDSAQCQLVLEAVKRIRGADWPLFDSDTKHYGFGTEIVASISESNVVENWAFVTLTGTQRDQFYLDLDALEK